MKSKKQINHALRAVTAVLALFLLTGKTTRLMAQDTSFVQYTGKYLFPSGGTVDEATVSLENGALMIKAALGQAALKRVKGDAFALLQYDGKVEFLRDEQKKVTGIKVQVGAAGIDAEGKKADADSAGQQPEGLAPSAARTGKTTLPAQRKKNLDVQAHAGGCGLYPCNTVEAFINAVRLGASTLEMDCVISKDSLVLVSHDQFMTKNIITPEGKTILPSEELQYNIFKMSYDSVRKYDAGSAYDPGFPTRKRIKTSKPLLSEVFSKVEAYIAENRLPKVNYNIEIKSLRGDNVYHPMPNVFTDLVVGVIKEKGLDKRVLIQSFDVRALQHLHRKYPAIPASFLVHNELDLDQNLARLGFEPAVFSPEYHMVTPEMVARIKKTNMQLIPWTVDKKEDMQRLIDLGADGIITNYPDVAIELRKSLISRTNKRG
ncbi:glycerophosphodiester phosphodiesterase family protein [Arcticibacter sp. MXS-1]|uniref:glycerophosphodiester phosphodiesterase family protein n=1 Tax=Arcticibacter sp. MXS-1 TaxID=3341726 RepID=UPI0035A857DB